MSDKTIKFKPSGRGKAQCEPDPLYPHGKAIPKPPENVFPDTCFIELPYPAPECGIFIVSCETCKTANAITAAGRPDDPISFYMPCLRKKG
jgi:hypothetical protein